MVCYRTALLLLCFLMLAFRPLGFKSTVPVDVVRAKSYASCPYDPACEELGVKINRPLLRSKTAEVCVLASRISLSCSLILSCKGLPVSPM